MIRYVFRIDWKPDTSRGNAVNPVWTLDGRDFFRGIVQKNMYRKNNAWHWHVELSSLSSENEDEDEDNPVKNTEIVLNGWAKTEQKAKKKVEDHVRSRLNKILGPDSDLDEITERYGTKALTPDTRWYGATPTQLEGLTLTGKPFYFRARSGAWVLRVGPRLPRPGRTEVLDWKIVAAGSDPTGGCVPSDHVDTLVTYYVGAGWRRIDLEDWKEGKYS